MSTLGMSVGSQAQIAGEKDDLNYACFHKPVSKYFSAISSRTRLRRASAQRSYPTCKLPFYHGSGHTLLMTYTICACI